MYKSLLQKIKQKKAKICVVGLGYVGLPTAIYFAEQAFEVIGVAIEKRKVDLINEGKSPIGELKLDDRLSNVLKNNKLTATLDLTDSIEKSDVILFIVPTPVTKSKDPDLSHIIDAGKKIANGLGRGKLVILESTVYPGVTEEILQPILEKSGLKAGEEFGLAYCPERYNPGDVVHTIENVSRIVGGITPEWAEVASELYRYIIKEEVKVLPDIKTAEASKIIENIQRDLNIALMNELAMIFEKINIDIMDVIDGASTKWNFNVYYPGGGVGGHCLPVDPYYLVAKAKELGYHSKVITAGRTVNDYMPEHICNLVVDSLNNFEKSVKNSKIVILGFSYKENMGDARGSPSIDLLNNLIQKKAKVVVVDPHVDDIGSCGELQKNVYTALEKADLAVLMTAHDDFMNLDFEKIKNIMRIPIIVDARRIYNPSELRKLGFHYSGVGAITDIN